MTIEFPGGASDRAGSSPASDAVQSLRQAEAHLARRRLASQRRGATDRAAIRFVIERTRDGHEVSPSDLGRHLDISTASVTAVLDRLVTAQMIVVRPHPTDRRRKLIEPFDPTDDEDVADPLTARIRLIASQYSGVDERVIVEFLTRITDAINEENAR